MKGLFKDRYQYRLDEWANGVPLDAHRVDVGRMAVARVALESELCPNFCGEMIPVAGFENLLECSDCEFRLIRSSELVNVYAAGEGRDPVPFTFGTAVIRG